MTRWLIGSLIVLFAAASAVSCGTSSSQPGEDDRAACSGGCGYSIVWPRVIVGIVPPVGDDVDGADLVEVTGKSFPAGDEYEANRHACPETLASEITCSYSFAAAPADESMTVYVDDLDGESIAEVDIPLEDFNRCGVDVAYFTVTLNDDEAPVVGEVRYVTPCGGALD